MIIKIDQAKSLKYSSNQMKKSFDIINVFKGTYSDDLIAYFVRSQIGLALFVNDKLTPTKKARAIKIIKDEVERCGISEMGLINGNWIYKCGGTCCQNNANDKEGSV